MTYESSILRALFRLSKRGALADLPALVLRVGGTLADVRHALRRLERCGLVVRSHDDDTRLTLEGLAVAVASRSAGGRPSIGVRRQLWKTYGAQTALLPAPRRRAA